MTRTALLAATIAMGWALAAGAQTIRYVAQGGQTPAAPYLNWATAASNIQDAVDAAEDGDTVLVSNGLYNTGGQRLPDEGFLTNRVFVANAVTVRSVNGPAATTIRGNATEGGNAVRCVLLQSGAVLDGFALAGGGVISDVMSLYDGFGGGVLLKEGGIISNCWISGCKGSGVYMFRGGRMADCLVQSNTSLSGGGVICEPSDFAENEIERCRILDNTAEASGGGIFSMGNLKIHDSLICGNLAADASVGIGGGIWMSGGTIANCTIAWNESRCKGGGIGDLSNPEYGQQLCEIVNTILYHNTAPIGSNFHVLGTSITYSCTYPLPEGDGNTAEAPLLLGFRNPHIAAASPCRGAGTTSCLYAGETDIDGEPRAWGGSADIGCDQFVYTNIAGTLNMVIDAPFTNALVNEPLRFRSALEGKADVFTWTVATPTGAMLRANEADWTYAWNMTGVYAVALSATNSACAAAVTATVTIVDHFTNYFDPAGSHVPPFTNWSQAATNLQDAIDACRIGGMVMVQTGVHACADEVLLNRGVTVRGAGTAADTAFVGGGSNRCFSLADPDAALERITISNGKAATGAGVYLSGGTVRQCVLSGNSATIKGGGAYMERGGLLEDCRISGNYALKWGGGAFVQGDARISRCLVISNATDYYGGGLYAYLGAQADNCYFAGNSSWGGGGMILFIGCAARNCTLARNMAEGDGGGIFFLDSTAINCLVYFNEAADYSSDNYFFDVTDQSSVISHCCADPLPAGDGNMAVNPLLAGIENPHLLAASPCRAAGDASAVAPGATDIDGEPRAHGGAADIGCDEYIPGAVTGALAVAISGDTNTIYGVAELLGADISGKATGLAWRVGRGAGQYDCMTNLFEIAPVWTNAGYFEVVLSAGNESGGSSATVTVHVAAGGYTNYVSTSGAHVPPFTNWATASTSIQAAVDSCYEGGVVLVQTGRYEISSALLLAKPVSVQSVGGPELTTIDAGRRCRGVMIPADGVLLAGFTITNGYAAGAAGGFMLGGTVSNCVISGCAAVTMSGGIECHRNATLRNSVISGNTAWDWPGGVWLSDNALALNCLISDNAVHNVGGGVFFFNGGSAVQCLVQGNTAARGGGMFFEGGGVAQECLVFSNAAANGGGAFFEGGGRASNCLFSLNWAVTEGGGAWFQDGGEMDQCSLLGNHADTTGGHGGGALCDGGGTLRDCLIADNEAAYGAGVWMQFGGQTLRCLIRNNHAVWGDPMFMSAGVGGGFFAYAGGLVSDSIIEKNSADQDAGGGVLQYAGQVSGCTIVDNTASNNGGGVYFVDGGAVQSSIIWSNHAATNENYVYDDAATVSHSCADPLPSGAGNLACNPLFLAAAAGNWRLHWDSPCVDAGLDDCTESATDLDGNTRLAGAHEDMGCYELQERENMSAPDRITRRGFRANWSAVTMATNYLLDVSASSNFSTYIPGYQARDVGLATSQSVTGLSYCVRCYCRVRAASAYGVGVNSSTTNALTIKNSEGNDFSGVGASGFVVYDRVHGKWYVLGTDGSVICWDLPFGSAGFEPVPGDYNGDGISDLAVYYRQSALWFIVEWTGAGLGNVLAWAEPWGWPDADPVSGDYDGDGASDMVVYGSDNGEWYLRRVDGQLLGWCEKWGGEGFQPVPGDYNGDGINDLGVFYDEHGLWFVMGWAGTGSGSLIAWAQEWGWPGAKPVSGDYDGDGVSDCAVYNTNDGYWYIWSLGNGQVVLWAAQWGGPGFEPVAGDFDGDGISDLTVYYAEGGLWYTRTVAGQVLVWSAHWGGAGLDPVDAGR